MNITVNIPDNAAADLASAGQDPARALHRSVCARRLPPPSLR
jgi:hypothetical protein